MVFQQKKAESMCVKLKHFLLFCERKWQEDVARYHTVDIMQICRCSGEKNVGGL
jgi:hypothetical protein